MSNYILNLITVSISGSIAFLIAAIIVHFLKERYSQPVYMMIKLISLFFLVSTGVMIGINNQIRIKATAIDMSDFMTMTKGDIENPNNLIYGEEILIVLFLIWLVVFVLFYLYPTLRGISFMRRLIRTSQELRDKNKLDVVELLKKQLNIKRNVKIYQSMGISSPFVIGIFQIKIILPKTSSNIYEDENFRMALLHELIHLKNHDVPFKMLLSLIENIHWFNPFVHLCIKPFYNLTEFVCDEKVVEKMDKNERFKYASLIVSIQKEKANMPDNMLFLKNDNYRFMERRLYKIMNYKKKKITMKIMAVLTIFAVSTPFITYASSIATTEVQNKIVRNLQKFEAEEQLSGDTIEYMEEAVYSEDELDLGAFRARGVNPFDFPLAPGQFATFNAIYLNKGATISFSCISDSQQDQYIVGYRHKGVITYVRAINGMVGHVFTIPENGDYEVYFRSDNVTTNLHLQGHIIVNR